MLNAGIVLERDTIYDRIWGFDFETGSRSLDVYIGYLRRKTEADGEPRLLHTVRGVGYVAADAVSLRWRIALGLALDRRAGRRVRRRPAPTSRPVAPAATSVDESLVRRAATAVAQRTAATATTAGPVRTVPGACADGRRAAARPRRRRSSPPTAPSRQCIDQRSASCPSTRRGPSPSPADARLARRCCRTVTDRRRPLPRADRAVARRRGVPDRPRPARRDGVDVLRPAAAAAGPAQPRRRGRARRRLGLAVRRRASCGRSSGSATRPSDIARTQDLDDADLPTDGAARSAAWPRASTHDGRRAGDVAATAAAARHRRQPRAAHAAHEPAHQRRAPPAGPPTLPASSGRSCCTASELEVTRAHRPRLRAGRAGHRPVVDDEEPELRRPAPSWPRPSPTARERRTGRRRSRRHRRRRPATCRVRPHMVERAMANLVDNAVKYSPPGRRSTSSVDGPTPGGPRPRRRASTRTTSRTCSTASTARRRPAPSPARASVWPSCARSSSATAARSGPPTRTAAAPPSASVCRRRPPSPDRRRPTRCLARPSGAGPARAVLASAQRGALNHADGSRRARDAVRSPTRRRWPSSGPRWPVPPCPSPSACTAAITIRPAKRSSRSASAAPST